MEAVHNMYLCVDVGHIMANIDAEVVTEVTKRLSGQTSWSAWRKEIQRNLLSLGGNWKRRSNLYTFVYRRRNAVAGGVYTVSLFPH